MSKRNSLEIRVWMLRNGVRQAEISEDTGVGKSNVTRTIDGERDCRAVLKNLLDRGCPAKILNLPQDMRRAA